MYAPSHYSISGLASALLSVILIAGCQQGLDTFVSCKPYTGTYHIGYVGHALGKGQLELSTPTERGEILKGQLTLWDETGTDATLNLVGPGSCEQGLISLRFGAADHPQARVRVLGGTATIVPPQGKVEELFGIWNVEAEIKENGIRRSLEGFFRQVTANDTPQSKPVQSQKERQSALNQLPKSQNIYASVSG